MSDAPASMALLKSDLKSIAEPAAIMAAWDKSAIGLWPHVGVTFDRHCTCGGQSFFDVPFSLGGPSLFCNTNQLRRHMENQSFALEHLEGRALFSVVAPT